VWSALPPLPGGRHYTPAGILSAGRPRSAGSVVKVPLRCADAACRFEAAVFRGRTLLGGGVRLLPADRRVTVKLRLGAAGRAALRHGRRLKLTLDISEVVPGGFVRRHLTFTS
jgi:hypothetical protein